MAAEKKAALMHEKLAAELLQAYNRDATTARMPENVHRMADANKACCPLCVVSVPPRAVVRHACWRTRGMMAVSALRGISSHSANQTCFKLSDLKAVGFQCVLTPKLLRSSRTLGRHN